MAAAAVAITIPITIAAIIKSQRGKPSVFISGCEVSFGMLVTGGVSGIAAVAEGVCVVIAEGFSVMCVSGGSAPIQGPGRLLPNHMVAWKTRK